MKKQMLISFSGGETSAFMLNYLLNVWEERNEWEFAVVFANTGEENEETLDFVEKCSKYFNINVVWVEALVDPKKGKGTKHKIVDYKTASRKGEPFEDVISKYGIPNKMFPHCNRELKLQPIHSYIKYQLGWKDYYTAIGIRYDEIDRMNTDRKKNKIVYPLIEYKRMTKQKINYFWSEQPFRLNLKGYQGNCKTCWKKSFRNLYTIAKENPEYFDFYKKMEDKYSFVVSDGRDEVKGGAKFFRGNKSVLNIMKEAENFNGIVKDSHKEINFQSDLFDLIDEVESCDIYSNCSDL